MTSFQFVLILCLYTAFCIVYLALLYVFRLGAGVDAQDTERGQPAGSTDSKYSEGGGESKALAQAGGPEK